MNSIFYILLSLFLSSNSTNQASITGVGDKLAEGQVVQMTITKYGSYSYEPLATTVTTEVHLGQFHFNLPVEAGKAYITIAFPDGPLSPIRNIAINAGADLIISFNGDKIVSKGEGALMFNVQNRLNGIYEAILGNSYLSGKDKLPTIRHFKYIDSAFTSQCHYLDSLGGDITDDERVNLKRDVYLKGEIAKSAVFDFVVDEHDFASVEEYKRLVMAYRVDRALFYEKHKVGVPSELERSAFYPKYVFGAYMVDSLLFCHREESIINIASHFLSEFPGRISEEILVRLLHDRARSVDSTYQQLVDTATAVIKNRSFSEYAKRMREAHGVGLPGYNFHLLDSLGKDITLASFRGNVVVLDFWFTGCGNCVKLEPYMKAIAERFANQPIKFLSVNVDGDREMWLRSVASGKYTSSENVNLNTGKSGVEHPLLKYYDIKGYPTLLVFDKRGLQTRSVVEPRIDKGRDLTMQLEALLKDRN